MIAEIFLALLITSLAGSCLAAVILLARPLTRKVFGYAWHYYIWLAVLFVMLLPVRFSLPQAADTLPSVSPSVQTGQAVQAEQVQNSNAAAPAPQATPETSLMQAGANFIKGVADSRMNIVAYIWLTGAIILLLTNVIGYVRLITKIRKTSMPVSCPELADFTKRKVKVRVWENTSSPFMVGILKPALILPACELTEEQLNNILRHETTHLKRHDILYKWFVVFVKCLHWFNPVIWAAAKQINVECEISCDMAVTQGLTHEEEQSYIDTLLSLLPMGKTRQIPLTTQMASSKKILKRRFLMMKTKKTTSKFVSVLSVILALTMLSATVFASGVLSGLTEDNYTVEITNNGEVIELVNKPFIENGEVYVPLREIFEKVGVMELSNSNIIWKNGVIGLMGGISFINQNNLAEQDFSEGTIFLSPYYEIEIGKAQIVTNPSQEAFMTVQMENAPVLRSGNTYIPYSYINYLLKNETWNIDYTVYDKEGNIIDTSDSATELISWGSEPEIFADPYSDFLIENISQSLSSYEFSDTYSYEYILHRYNHDNDSVTFQYQLKPNGEDKTYILSMLFENRNNNWVKYDFYVVDPVRAAVVK